MDKVDQLLGLTALAFAVFLVLSAAVEAVLEALRGIFGQVIPQLKGAVPLENALLQAREFAPAGGEVEARLSALKATAERMNVDLTQVLTQSDTIIKNVNRTTNFSIPEVATMTREFNAAAEDLSKTIENYERRRILILRIASGVIGSVMCLITSLDIFDILAQAEGFSSLRGFADASYVGEAITGIAASSGSSYLHDKLDKVRSLKNVQQSLAGLTQR